MKRNLLLVAALQLLVLLFFYYDIIFCANQKMIWISGDGLKNYYMFSYYVAHFDKIFIHNGFAFPFGEYLFKSDSHPLLAIVIGLLGKIFPFLTQNTVGILNLIMLLNPVFTTIILFKIFKIYEVADNISIIASIGISSLSPQFLLLTVGHFSQVYSFFIPLNLFLIIKLLKFNELKQIRKIFVLTIVGFFTHVYIGSMLLFFNLVIVFLIVLYDQKRRGFGYKLFLVNLLSLFIVIAIFYFDPIEGRPELKAHAMHRAAFCNVFMPRYSDFFHFYNFFFNLSQQAKYTWSGVGTYVGLTSNLFIIITLTSLIIRLMLKKTKDIFFGFLKVDLFILISAIVLLLFSFGIPTLIDHGFILNRIPFASQIMAIGRFSYIFYYVITILSVVFFYRLLSKTIIQKWVLFGLTGLFFFESYAMHNYIDSKIPGRENVFSEKVFDRYYDYKDWQISANEYDAILPIPIYLRHFLPITRSGTLSSEELSMALSMRTGLPIMAVFLSRPSVQNSQTVLNFIENKNDFLVKKSYQDKKFLVVHTKEFNNDTERSFIKELDPVIFDNGKILVSEIDANFWMGSEMVEY